MTKIYRFDDQSDLLILNRRLRTAGIIIQQDLFGSYVAFVNETIQNTELKPATKKKRPATTAAHQ